MTSNNNSPFQTNINMNANDQYSNLIYHYYYSNTNINIIKIDLITKYKILKYKNITESH